MISDTATVSDPEEVTMETVERKRMGLGAGVTLSRTW